MAVALIVAGQHRGKTTTTHFSLISQTPIMVGQHCHLRYLPQKKITFTRPSPTTSFSPCRYLCRVGRVVAKDENEEDEVEEEVEW